jgi:hypothetical protein
MFNLDRILNYLKSLFSPTINSEMAKNKGSKDTAIKGPKKIKESKESTRTLIKEAITHLNDPTGSTLPDIAGYLNKNHTLDFDLIKKELKVMLRSDDLRQIKHSFKLPLLGGTERRLSCDFMEETPQVPQMEFKVPMRAEENEEEMKKRRKRKRKSWSMYKRKKKSLITNPLNLYPENEFDSIESSPSQQLKQKEK